MQNLDSELAEAYEEGVGSAFPSFPTADNRQQSVATLKLKNYYSKSSNIIH